MKELIESVVTFIVGCIITIIIISKFPQKEFRSEFKINPDYELEAKGKVVDTIWIYKIK